MVYTFLLLYNQISIYLHSKRIAKHAAVPIGQHGDIPESIFFNRSHEKSFSSLNLIIICKIIIFANFIRSFSDILSNRSKAFGSKAWNIHIRKYNLQNCKRPSTVQAPAYCSYINFLRYRLLRFIIHINFSWELTLTTR